MKKRFLSLILFLICINPMLLNAQTDTIQDIVIHGMVRDENGQPLSNAILINKRLKTGFFGKPDGTFYIRCRQADTIAVTSLGFHTREFTFRDSAYKSDYHIELYLDARVYRLSEVTIFASRDLEKIQKDIEQLGYNEDDYMLSGINAAQSPITFLYQQFSRKEQSRRLAAQLNNEDRKRELLKELFHHYVDYEIIDLSDDEFDGFINYLNVSDEFLKSSTQYDFLIYVRDRFKDYKIHRRQVNQLKDGDFEYDKD